MEDHAAVSNNESKNEVKKKQPLIVAEWVETPELQAAMDHHNGVLKPPAEHPSEGPVNIRNSNESKNPLLADVEQEVLEHMNNQLRLQAAVVAAVVVFGGYHAWKAGWFNWLGLGAKK